MSVTVGHSTGGAPSKVLRQPAVHFSAYFECVMLGGEAFLSFHMEMEFLSLRVSEFSTANGDIWRFLSFWGLLTITGGLITAITDTGKSISV